MNESMMAEMGAIESSLVTTESMAAIELSEDELNTVSGGVSVSLGSGSDFFQTNLAMGQQTFAGPNGSGTTNLVNFQQIASSAQQLFSISQ